MKHRHTGFTLVEMLVSITIVITLASLGYAGYHRVSEKSRTVVEINAARNLITAYLSHAADNSGQVLPGYKEDPAATNLNGQSLGYPSNARYPFRLAPSVPTV